MKFDEKSIAAPPHIQAVQTLAQTIRANGLEIPALLVLEVGKPLSLLGGQLLWIAQPALSLLVSRQKVGAWAQLLEDPQLMDALIVQLDEERAA